MSHQSSQTLNHLRTLSLFAGLGEETLLKLAGQSEMLPLKQGDTLWTQGAEVTHFFIVLDGCIKVIRQQSNTVPPILYVVESGQAALCKKLLEGEDTETDGIAIRDSLVLGVRLAEFRQVLHTNHKLLQNLLLATIEHHHQLLERVVEIVPNAAEQRLASLLFRHRTPEVDHEGWGQRGRDPEPIHVKMALTQWEMGQLLKLHRNTVSRVVSRWRSEGWFVPLSKGFLIRDWKRLEGLAMRSLP